SVKALEAGNDVLCLPADIPGSIKSIREAIRKKQLDATDINKRVKKVLLAKYQYGLSAVKPIDLDNLTEDLNEKSEAMRRLIAADALTLLKNDDKSIFPLAKGKKVAYVGIGLDKDNEFARQLREEYDAHVYYFDYKTGAGLIPPLMDLLGYRYDAVVIGVNNFSRFPRNNFGISPAAFSLIEQLQQRYRTITMGFGNPYAMKNLCDNRVL